MISLSRPRGGSTVVTYLTQIAVGAVPIVTMRGKALVLAVLLAGTLGIYEYGVWVQAIVTANLACALVGPGLTQALVRFFPQSAGEGRAPHLFWSIVALAAILSAPLLLIGVLAAPLLSSVLVGDPRQVGAFWLAAVLVPAYSIRMVLLHLFTALDQVNRFSVLTTVGELLDLALLIVLMQIWPSAASALLASVIAVLAMIVGLLWWSVKRLGRPTWAWKEARLAFSYALPLAPMQINDSILARGDRLLMGIVIGPAAAGIYSILYSLGSLPSFLNFPVTNALFPKLTWRQSRGAGTEARWIWFTMAGALAVLVVGIALLALCGEWLATLIAGPAAIAEAGVNVRLSILVIAFGVACFSLGRILSVRLFLGMRTGLVALLWFGATLANLVLNLLWLPVFGIMGAALSTAVAYAAFLVALVVVSSRAAARGR